MTFRDRVQVVHRVLQPGRADASKAGWFLTELRKAGIYWSRASLYNWLNGRYPPPEEVEGVLRILEADCLLEHEAEYERARKNLLRRKKK